MSQRCLWTAAVFFCGWACTAIAAEPAPIDPAQQQQYLLLIKSLADSADLANPDEVARRLHLHFTEKHQRFDSSPGKSPFAIDCRKAKEEGSDSRVGPILDVDTYTPGPDFWSKLIPGRNASSVPDDGHPSTWFSYTIKKMRTCAGPHNDMPLVDAEILLGTTPAFFCVKEDAIASAIPEARQSFATDGGRYYSYDAQVTEGKGIAVSFGFNLFSSPCLRDIRIEQAERLGMKAQLAQHNFNVCVKRLTDAYYATHPAMPSPNGSGALTRPSFSFFANQCRTSDKK